MGARSVWRSVMGTASRRRRGRSCCSIPNRRGLQAGPLLPVGDGAMGFRAALEEVFPATRGQRCWIRKMGNVPNALPKSQQGQAKADLLAKRMAATRADAHAAFDRFVTIYAAKYSRLLRR